MALSSDSTKYFMRHVQQATTTITELQRTQAKFKESQQVEAARTELLKIWTSARYKMIRREDVPRSVTVKLGELIRMMNRVSSIEDHRRLIQAFNQLTAPYTKK